MMKASLSARILVLAAMGVASITATLINGAGATFPYPIYSKWFDVYHKLNPEVRINYQAIGSGGGIRQLTQGTVDFGATDVPMTDRQIAAAKGRILHFPTVLGAVVPTYNVPGIRQDLNFTPEALAGIQLGRIRKWNHQEIANANPGVALPANDILVVHRSDGSGTTFIWTDYLSKVSGEWKQEVGAGPAVRWPAGLGAKGNEGVAGLIKQMPNSFGYVELVYALQNRMNYGSVRNSAGQFVKPDMASVTAAAAGAAASMPSDFRVSITNAPGENAYPISSFTWLLVPERIPDPTKRKIMIDFLHWMLGPGQRLTSELSYAPLPKQVVSLERKAISKIK